MQGLLHAVTWAMTGGCLIDRLAREKQQLRVAFGGREGNALPSPLKSRELCRSHLALLIAHSQPTSPYKHHHVVTCERHMPD